MDQGHRECPFAYCGSNPLDGLGAYVARYEDTWNAGFQQVRVALQIPATSAACHRLSTPGR